MMPSQSTDPKEQRSPNLSRGTYLVTREVVVKRWYFGVGREADLL